MRERIILGINCTKENSYRNLRDRKHLLKLKKLKARNGIQEVKIISWNMCD